MKKRNFWLMLLSVAVFVSFATGNVLACACCSEPGTYRISTLKPDNYKFELLSKMKFAPKAELYLTGAGEDGVKGLEQSLKSDSAESATGESLFNLSGLFAVRTWKLIFKDANGQSGTLTLPIPTTMVDFDADIHDGKEGSGGGPLLYKEWRFKGNVMSGTGIFQKGIVAPTTYFLVFQGRGNNCDNAEDFTHWRVEINGKKADYAFFGEMASSNPN